MYKIEKIEFILMLKYILKCWVEKHYQESSRSWS